MYSVNIIKRKYSEHDLFNNIKIVWDKLKRQPKFRDLNENPSTICAATYIWRFGSWNNAIISFAKYNGENLKLNIQKPKRTKLNNSLRFDIMKRDNFKCVICGKSPANNNCKRLEIDHIVPISKNGTNKFDNLRTLCEICNSGKFNKF